VELDFTNAITVSNLGTCPMGCCVTQSSCSTQGNETNIYIVVYMYSLSVFFLSPDEGIDAETRHIIFYQECVTKFCLKLEMTEEYDEWYTHIYS
jgi:hypothetical protein